MTEDGRRFKRALNSGMIVAIAKLSLLNKCWESLRPNLEKLNAQERENARIGLRERINSLPPDLFFMPPEEALSEERVGEYFQEKFKSDGLQKLVAELTSRTYSLEPDLQSYEAKA